MSKYLRSNVREFEFDGDTVAVRFKPLTRAAALAMTQVIDAPDGEDKLRVIATALRDHVEEFKGLRTADGSEVPLEEALVGMYFTKLVGQMAESLLKTGLVNFKEPGSLSADGSGTSAPTASDSPGSPSTTG